MWYHWTHTLGICIRYSIVCLILHNPIITPHLQEMQLLSHFFIVCTYTFFHFVECLLNMSIYFCDLSAEESLAEPLMIMSNLYHQSNALIHDCNLILNTLTDHHGWPTKHLGVVSIRKTVLPGMAIPMLKIRRPNGRLIFNMEIAIRR